VRNEIITIHAAQAEAAVRVILHHVVTEDATANAKHDSRKSSLPGNELRGGQAWPPIQLWCGYAHLVYFPKLVATCS
jgi:hypothetical protein